MAIEHVEYADGPLEQRDNDRALSDLTDLKATAHEFEEGTGQPLFAPPDAAPDDAWDAESVPDGYQDADGFEFEGEPPSEPQFDLQQAAEYFESLSPAMGEAWLEDIGADARQQIVDAYAGLQSQQQATRYADLLDNRAAYSEQQAQLAEQQSEDNQVIGHEVALGMVDQIAQNVGTKIDNGGWVLEQLEESAKLDAAVMRSDGASPEQIWAEVESPDAIYSRLEQIVAEEKSVNDRREMQVRSGLGIGPYPGGSWVRPS